MFGELKIVAVQVGRKVETTLECNMKSVAISDKLVIFRAICTILGLSPAERELVSGCIRHDNWPNLSEEITSVDLGAIRKQMDSLGR